MTTPQPLPANSRRLRRKRYVAWVGHKHAEGRYLQDDSGRFTTLEDAEAWVAETHPDAEKVRYTFYMESDGWRPHPVGGTK